MKRDDKRQLLASPVAELKTKLRELQVQLLQARQARFGQQAQPNVRLAYTLRQQIQMIMTELRRRELETETE